MRAAAVNTAEAAMVAADAEAIAADAAMDAAREDAAAGDAADRDAPAMRGRTGARVCRSGCRAGSAVAGSRQAASRAQMKRRIQSDRLREHIH